MALNINPDRGIGKPKAKPGAAASF